MLKLYIFTYHCYKLECLLLKLFILQYLQYYLRIVTYLHWSLRHIYYVSGTLTSYYVTTFTINLKLVTSNLTIWLVSKNPWFVHHSNHVDLDCTIENDLFYLNNRLPQGRHHYLPDLIPFWNLPHRKFYQCPLFGTAPRRTHLKLDSDLESSLVDLNQIVNNIHISAVRIAPHHFLNKKIIFVDAYPGGQPIQEKLLKFRFWAHLIQFSLLIPNLISKNQRMHLNPL